MSPKKKAIKKREKEQIAVAPARKKNGKPVSSKKPMLIWVLLLVAVLPFIFSRETIDSNIPLRYTLLSGFVFLFLLYFYVFRKKLIVTGWPLLVKLVFIMGIAWGCWNFVGLFTAVNRQQVYYGIGRHFLNMLMLFIITQVAAKEEGHLLQLCKLLSIVAIIHGFIGICQFYELAFTELPGNFPPYGLMANRNLFGSAQVLLMPFAIFTLYKGRAFWKYSSILSLTAIILSAIYSQTRSAWLAAIGIAIISLLLVLLFSPANRKKWLIGTGIGLLATGVLVFLVIQSDTKGTISASLKERAKTFAPANAPSDQEGTSASNVTERLKIWNTAIRMIKEYPVTGVGAGNWKVVVPKYGTAGLIWAKGFYVPDWPHNDYLLVAAESGIPGAIMYFGMWLLIALLAWKTIRKAATEERRMLNILMLSGLAAFAIDSMFSFPASRIEHSLYLFLMGGIVIGTFINNRSAIPKNEPINNGLLIGGLVVAAFNLLMGFSKISFEKHFVLSKAYWKEKMFQQSIEEGEKAKSALISLDPEGFPVENFVALSFKDMKNYPQALKEFDAGIRYHPYNKILYINKGTVYTEMHQFDTAIVYYKKALALTPEFDVIYQNLGANYFYLGDYKTCLEYMDKYDLKGNKGLISIRQEASGRLALQNQPPK